jgi:hypothetical protein
MHTHTHTHTPQVNSEVLQLDWLQVLVFPRPIFSEQRKPRQFRGTYPRQGGREVRSPKYQPIALCSYYHNSEQAFK